MGCCQSSNTENKDLDCGNKDNKKIYSNNVQDLDHEEGEPQLTIQTNTNLLSTLDENQNNKLIIIDTTEDLNTDRQVEMITNDLLPVKITNEKEKKKVRNKKRGSLNSQNEILSSEGTVLSEIITYRNDELKLPFNTRTKDSNQSPNKQSVNSPRKSILSSPKKSPLKSPSKSPLKSPSKSQFKSPRKGSIIKILDNKIVVFLVYPSGTNKDESLFPYLKDYGFEKISVGSLLKEASISHTYKEEISKCLAEKSDVKDDIVVELIKEEISKSNSHRFLISGFPKNENNSEAWKRIINDEIEVAALILITYTRKEYEKELSERKEKYGSRIGFKEAVLKFDYYLKNTLKVFDDFGSKKSIKISSTVEDKTIAGMILKNEILSSYV